MKKPLIALSVLLFLFVQKSFSQTERVPGPTEKQGHRFFMFSRQYTTAALAGKRLKIGWKELKVYLPQAKGYYKVKEITSVNIE